MSDTTTEPTVTPAVDSRLFRDVLGHYPTGVVAVTGVSATGEPLAMIVGTFSSVSLDPPLVSFMPTKGSATYTALRESPSFCINVFAHDQSDETRTLAQRDPNKLDKVEWSTSANGIPQIKNAVAYIHCARTQEIEAGDHSIVLCEVSDVEVSRPVNPLVFFQGGYGAFTHRGGTAYVDSGLIAAVRAAEVAHPQLSRLAERFDCEAVALAKIGDRDQTIGAAARGESVQRPSRLGTRLPLIPPLEESAIAWNENYAESWLGRIFPQTPELIEKYRSRLDTVREQGFALQIVPENGENIREELEDALHEYSLGQLTPARERAVSGAIAASAILYGTALPDDNKSVRLTSISAPVFDPTTTTPSNSGLVLRLRSLPQTSTPAQIREWAASLQEAAAQVTEALGNSNSRDWERYVESGLRD
jgi:flavin reductase (DIM6/NTAB) family NADH-FMN oxidoreductase RutF/DNA-binding IclR family transcriptional regulator